MGEMETYINTLAKFKPFGFNILKITIILWFCYLQQLKNDSMYQFSTVYIRSNCNSF